MNLGVYVIQNSENEQTTNIAKNLNEGISEGLLSDASLFYDVVGPNSLKYNFGAFNSTDIWNFSGDLITTDVQSTMKAISTVNKFRLLFYFGWEKAQDVMGLIHIVNNPNVKTICTNEETAKELTRLTAKKPLGIVNNFNIKDIIKVIK
jgi:hypothetical protein